MSERDVVSLRARMPKKQTIQAKHYAFLPSYLSEAKITRGSESCHSDHMKIIRTFSYLESRSDYLFYLIIPILIARNESSVLESLITTFCYISSSSSINPISTCSLSIDFRYFASVFLYSQTFSLQT